jgi:hypothetical protein
VAFIGNRVLVGIGSQVHAFDVDQANSSPTPPMASTVNLVLPGRVRALESQSGHVFAAAGSSIAVLDEMTTEPARPLANFDLESPVVELTAWPGHLAAAARETTGAYSFHVLDVDDPGAPKEIGRYTSEITDLVRIRATSKHLLALGSLGDGSHVLQIFDITDPSSPGFVDQYVFGDEDEGWPEDLAIVDGFAYVAMRWIKPTVAIIDLRDPAKPSRVGIVTETSSCNVSSHGRALLVSGDRLFVASTCFLDAYELDDPFSPTFASTGILWLPFMGAPKQPVSIASNGDAVSVLVDDGTFHVVGVQSVTSRGKVSLPSEALVSHGIAALRGHLLIASKEDQQIRVFDVDHPSKARQVASFRSGCFTCEDAYDPITIDGDYAFIAGTDSELVDLQDPTNPRRIEDPWRSWEENDAFYNTTGIAVAEERAYLNLNTGAGMAVFDISQPEAPMFIARVGEEWGAGAGANVAVAIAAQGRSVFFWGRESDWYGQALDLSDPTQPSRMATYFGGRSGCDRPGIADRGSYFYFACNDGLGMLDLGTSRGRTNDGELYYELDLDFATPHRAMHVAVDHDRVLLTDSRFLYVLDVSQPDTVRELARYEHTSVEDATEDWEIEHAMSIAHRDRVYVSSSVTGIHILNIDLPNPFDAARISLPWIGRGLR